MSKAVGINGDHRKTGQQVRQTSASTVRVRVLIGLLVFASAAYLATIPWQRKIMAETDRIERENASRQTGMAGSQAADTSLQSALRDTRDHPNDARAQMHSAQKLLDAGLLDEAEAHAAVAVGLQPRSDEPLLIYADVQQRRRHYDAAMNAYTAAIAVAREDPRPRVGLAYLYISFGWPREAGPLLKPMIARHPENPYLKAALALACVQYGNYVEAEKLLLAVQRLAPDSPELWLPLANVYNEMHRADQAIPVCRRAMVRLPSNAALVNELGKSYYHLNDLRQAEAAFRQALAILPDGIVSHYYLGLTLERSGDIPAAINELEFVARRAVDFEQTRQVLGRLYVRAGRLEDAKALLRDAAINQERAQKHQRAGLLLAGKPTDFAAHWQMAMVYNEEHNPGRALVEARKTLELSPGNRAAQQLVEQLRSAGVR